jgi:hypothetical protein
MAGDWFMMRDDICEDVDVIAMATELDTTEVHVAGMLCKFWGWVDRQMGKCHAPSVTFVWVDRYVCHDGFATAMQNVGWLRLQGDGIDIPNFDRYFSQSAKQRGLAAKRKAGERAKKSHARSVTKTRPQNRTEPETLSESLPVTGDALEGVRSRAEQLAQSTATKVLPDRDGLSDQDRRFFWGVAVVACLVMSEMWLADGVEATVKKKPKTPAAWLRTVLTKSAAKAGEDLNRRLKEVKAIEK